VSGVLLLLSSDLMLISSASHAARQAGLEFQNAASLEAATPKLQDPAVRLCLDLSCPIRPEDIAAVASPSVLRQAIAFGPHVHTARLEGARSAGFPTVLSRGQFVTRLQSGELFS
jgi:hypothetical protein